jgi:hypothetical protein
MNIYYISNAMQSLTDNISFNLETALQMGIITQAWQHQVEVSFWGHPARLHTQVWLTPGPLFLTPQLGNIFNIYSLAEPYLLWGPKRWATHEMRNWRDMALTVFVQFLGIGGNDRAFCELNFHVSSLGPLYWFGPKSCMCVCVCM